MKGKTLFSKTMASVRRCLKAAGVMICITALLVPCIPAAAEESGDTLNVTFDLEQVFEVPEETGNLEVDTKGTYQVSAADDDTAKALSDGIVVLDGASGGVLELTLDGNAAKGISLSFSKVGIYKFLIEQTTDGTGKDAYIYDDTTFTATIAVENGEKGLSFKKVIILNNVSKEKVDEIVFENKFGPCFIDPPIQKKVVDQDGNPASSDETFRFQMKADDPSWPMPEGSRNGLKEMTIQGSGSVEFGDIWYDKVGTYTYKVYEVEGSNEKIEYDTNVRNLTVTVTKGEDGLEAVREYSGQNKEKAVFVNKLKKEDEPTPTPTPTPPGPGPSPSPSPSPTPTPTQQVLGAVREVGEAVGQAVLGATRGVLGASRTGDDSHALAAGIITIASLIAIIVCSIAWLWKKRNKGMYA